MRLKLYLDLENENLPIQYRKNVISFIKLALSEYDEEYYKKFYNQKDNIIKPDTFAMFFRNPEFKNDEIVVRNKRVELNLSVADYETSIILYNAFNHQKNKKFSLNKNSWILRNISMIFEKEIKKEELVIKFMSTLVVRKRENNKDYYYSYENKEFLDTLKMNIKEQLKITDFPEKIVDNFNIEAVSAKKVIVKFYEKSIETSGGIFKISGDINLLKYLYEAGMGSKHSCGFGMFQIL